MKLYKKGLFIGRFQPYTLSHQKIILNQIFLEVSELIIGVGSTKKAYTIDNPFTFKEIAEMIQKSTSSELLKAMDVKYTIKAIEDIDDYPRWVAHVKSIVPEFDVVYTGNNLVKDLFAEAGDLVIPVKDVNGFPATKVRELINSDGDWQKHVPKGTADVINSVNGVERIKKLYRIGHHPLPTVDIIIEYQGGIVLIERKNKPFGWAIPGGFVEYGEHLADAAVREAKEETSLDIEIKKLLGVYSAPGRDKRCHTISHVFTAEGKGELKANDDAKDAKVFTRKTLPKKLAFDHQDILDDYFNKRYGSWKK